jgi:hypothetical protein
MEAIVLLLQQFPIYCIVLLPHTSEQILVINVWLDTLLYASQ